MSASSSSASSSSSTSSEEESGDVIYREIFDMSSRFKRPYSDVNGGLIGCEYVAFYTDCPHQVYPVKQGKRLTLSYTLHWDWETHEEILRQEAEWKAKKKSSSESKHQDTTKGSRKNSVSSPESHFDFSKKYGLTMKPKYPAPPTMSKTTKQDEEKEARTLDEQSADPVVQLRRKKNKILLPGLFDFEELKRILNSPEYTSQSSSTPTPNLIYRLPRELTDIIVDYLYEPNLIDLIFHHPDWSSQIMPRSSLTHRDPESNIIFHNFNQTGPSSRQFKRLGFLLDHSYPYFTLSLHNLSNSLETASKSNLGREGLFLKGHDFDIYQTLKMLNPNKYQVEIVPIRVIMQDTIYQGVWDMRTIPAEFFYQRVLEEHDDETKNNSYRSAPKVHISFQEILSFTSHGTLEHTTPLDDVRFINLTRDFLRHFLSNQPVSAWHEGDFDPTGCNYIFRDVPEKRTHYWDGDGRGTLTVYTDSRCGNAGYDEHVELQYVGSAIVISRIGDD